MREHCCHDNDPQCSTNELSAHSQLDSKIRDLWATRLKLKLGQQQKYSPFHRKVELPFFSFLNSYSSTWKSMVRFLSVSEGWTLFGALECLRRVGAIMTPSPGFLCRLPARLLQRVRNSCGSSNPESSRMHSGNAPLKLLWLALMDRSLPARHTAKTCSTV